MLHEMPTLLVVGLMVIWSFYVGKAMKWLKLFADFNYCVAALIGKTMQDTFADRDLCRLSVLLLREGVGIIREAGIPMASLPGFTLEKLDSLLDMPLEEATGIMNRTLTGLSKEPLYGFLLQSITRGKPSEIDFINGEVTHVASGIRSTSPLNRKVVDLIHRVEREGRFFTPEEIKKEFDLK